MIVSFQFLIKHAVGEKEKYAEPAQPVPEMDEEFEKRYTLGEWKKLGSILKQQVDPDGTFGAELARRCAGTTDQD